LKTEQSVFEKIEPTVSGLGYEVVDVEFAKKYGEDNLTVFIDCPNGVSLDDCEKVHYAIDPLLDELDPTGGKPYVLNVSSPGLDRPFKKQRDYERNYGKEVEIKLYAPMLGKKIYEGVLVSHTENTTEIECEGKQVKFENSKIAIARPLVKFE
jgi:ribosome maturation factor RimP